MLSTLLRFFELAVMVLGLSSLADSVVKWKGFLLSLVESYQSIVYPVWDILIGWLVQMPDFLKDYLILGLIVSSSFKRHMFLEGHHQNNFLILMEGIQRRSGVGIIDGMALIVVDFISLVYFTIIWPYIFVVPLYGMFIRPLFYGEGGIKLPKEKLAPLVVIFENYYGRIMIVLILFFMAVFFNALF